MHISKEELEITSETLFGGAVSELPDDRLKRLITISQYMTDVLLNEMQDRGLAGYIGGAPYIPYCSDHMVQTMLTGR